MIHKIRCSLYLQWRCRMPVVSKDVLCCFFFPLIPLLHQNLHSHLLPGNAHDRTEFLAHLKSRQAHLLYWGFRSPNTSHKGCRYATTASKLFIALTMLCGFWSGNPASPMQRDFLFIRKLKFNVILDSNLIYLTL